MSERPTCLRAPGEFSGLALLITKTAFQRLADPGGAALLLQDPRGELERWLVADVLAVTALQVRNPCSAIVLAEPDDRPIHATSLAGSA